MDRDKRIAKAVEKILEDIEGNMLTISHAELWRVAKIVALYVPLGGEWSCVVSYDPIKGTRIVGLKIRF